MTITQAIADLLSQTGSAHHQAFIEVDGDDPEWPLWYAERLQETLNGLLGSQMTCSEIVYHLVHLDREYMACRPENPWPQHYAEYFVKQVG